MLRLWVNAVTLPLDHTRCNTWTRWRSVDALLMLWWHSFSGEVKSRLTILPIKAAYTSIIGKFRSTALGSHKMQHPNSLTLCWRSFSEWGCDHVAVSVEHNTAKTSIMGKWHTKALELNSMQHPRLLTLCWRPVDALLTLYWRSVVAHFKVKWHRD